MTNAIKRFFAWVSGEAPEGQRKLVFCTRLELMLFALMLLKPTPEIGTELVSAMVTTGIVGVGGNGIEWASKAFSGKKNGNGAA
jgi:hypothetical protein